MKRLVNTQLFCLFKKMDGTLKLGESEIAPVYDEFVDTVIKICTSKEDDVPAYFTIQYTCLEMQQLRTMLNNETLKKSPHPKLHHP
ncbi:MAG: hypothetical protein ACK5M7_03060 [Draconibacterium sp.]